MTRKIQPRLFERKTPAEWLKGVMMMESHQNYTWIHYKNGRKKIYARTLGLFAEALCNNFFCRVNRSHLLNLNFMDDFQEVNSTKAFIKTSSGQVLKISKRKLKDVEQKINAFQKSSLI